ncbi:MAG TPA: hypothetical protein VH085_12595 [Nocardioides sp.]|jgi:hypothetical protein|nr:hypothetical protein [Nocardioides sp.]
MRFLTRTATATAAALITTGVAAITGIGITAAQASTTTADTDTVTVELTANDHTMVFDWSQEMCGSEMVPAARGRTTILFDTPRCVSGIQHCANVITAGQAITVVFYADSVTCTGHK